MLPALGLAILLHVHRLGYAVYSFYVVCRLQVSLLYLKLHQLSCQSHHAYVVSWSRLHSHDVALLQVYVVYIMIVALACVLELHLHKVGLVRVSRNVVQPVVCVELPVLSSASSVAQSVVAVACYLEFHIFKVCHVLKQILNL